MDLSEKRREKKSFNEKSIGAGSEDERKISKITQSLESPRRIVFQIEPRNKKIKIVRA